MARYCKSCADPQDILKVQIALEVTKETKTPKERRPSLKPSQGMPKAKKKPSAMTKCIKKNPPPRDQARGRY